MRIAIVLAALTCVLICCELRCTVARRRRNKSSDVRRLEGGHCTRYCLSRKLSKRKYSCLKSGGIKPSVRKCKKTTKHLKQCQNYCHWRNPVGTITQAHRKKK